MMRRLRRRSLLVLLALLAASGAAVAASRTRSASPATDALLKLTPAARAAQLAEAVGNYCIGSETFLMGVVTEGPGIGNAYWSLRCADGATWAVQVGPLGEVTAVDCASYAAGAPGKACFRKF